MMELLSILSFDRELFRAIHVGLHREFLDPIVLLISYSGDGIVQIPALLLLIWIKATRKYGVAALIAFLATGAVRLILRYAFERPRPSNYDFANPVTWPGGMAEPLAKIFEIVPYGNSSFPSGHTTTAFAIAFAIFWLTRGTDRAKWGILLLIWASLVGFARVYIGVHYPADVIAGAALAMICTAVLHLIRQKRSERVSS